MKKYAYLWITLIVIIIDQLSKLLIRNLLELGEIIKITPKIIWITYVQNTGAAFSLSFGTPGLNKIVFIILSLLAIFLIFYLLSKTSSKIEKISFALILGGAVGNLIDRIALGKVTDFVWCDFPDVIMTRWPVFNIADSSIVIAIAIIVAYTIFHRDKAVEEK
ncbi:MAG: signal peptidase II [Candidatus Cloacimonetes bacterium]|nr:signal peptidase II [Candidatus Cloacimonadota bacterium]